MSIASNARSLSGAFDVDEGHRLPTQTVSGMSKCFCGAIINNKTSGDDIRSRHMEITDGY